MRDKILKFLKILLLSIFLLFAYYPESYSTLLGRFITIKFRYDLYRSEIYKSGSFSEAIEDVSKKVQLSDIITNKEYLIERLNKIKFLKNRDKESTSSMYYYYDNYDDIDYIVVKTSSIINSDYITLIHELNHLIDRHKKVSVEIIPSSVMLSKNDVNKDQYLSYFNMISDIEIRDEETDDIKNLNLIELLYEDFNDQPEYYLSDSEVYARLSSLKNFLHKSGYIGIEENISERIVNQFLCDISSDLNFKYLSTTDDEEKKDGEHGLNDGNYTKTSLREYDNLLEIIVDSDFIVILPFINWNKEEELNIFV